ncbi:unnamed protein product [Ceutorhynchus assimilis]|uniref:Mab-21-like nucleotidyltransferase domain-containing protein n=1 Tax=Ceutorhynchus assimilis TaxID=467358 RepID=A0A9N9MEV1_9CUCU|nr:unnamed protein product [Ceutorhynchus assimilis]
MEEVLITINRDFISLQDEELKYNNILLRSTLDSLILIMQKEDPLFKTLFERLFYGGSFYDNLKVQNPNEFDIHLLMVLPSCEIHKSNTCKCVRVERSDRCGYVWFKTDKTYYAAISSWIDSKGFVQTNLVLNCIAKTKPPTNPDVAKAQKKMEEVLITINRDFISLQDEELKYNNILLRSTLDSLILIMQKEDPLFKTLFERLFYGGSFYDNLKVQNPNEFDIHLLMVLPSCEIHKSNTCKCVRVERSDRCGYVWFKTDKTYYAAISSWIDSKGFVQTNLVLNWKDDQKLESRRLQEENAAAKARRL